MSDPIISAANLSKSYLVGHRRGRRERYTALRDVIAREARNFVRKGVDLVRGRQIVQGDDVEEFWALKNIDFEINQGEVVGIIGRNGAGKSTLLKVLSRITDPTEGRVILRGRVASLLEVGTGFHFELTGRENIFLNGAIMGMTQREIRAKFDEIVAFSGVERFLDTPVKHYSSGMYVRLAFAVAAHLDPEILLVDEVLAVGDAEFQRKCLGKMSDIARGGRTVLFVSHSNTAIRNLCTHAIVLQNGRAAPKQSVQSALELYSSEFQAVLPSSWKRPKEMARPPVHFESIDARLEGSQPALQLVCTACIKSTPGALPVSIAIDIMDGNLNCIMQAIPSYEPFIGGVQEFNWIDVVVELPPLIPGVYYLKFWIGLHNTEVVDSISDAIAVEVTESPSVGRSFPYYRDHHGSVVPVSSATVRTLPDVRTNEPVVTSAV